jgi:glutamyl-tRNA synthetase
MHLGNLRTALIAWLHARAIPNNHFILRFEDLDFTRVRQTSFESIRRDLEWIGLDWDAEFVQSQHLERYQNALERLETYPCTCTRKEIQNELQEAASAPHTPLPTYPQTCLHQPIKANFPAAIRWKIPNQSITFQDHILGTLEQNMPLEVGDFVLKRGDGAFAYHLAVVVDDFEMGITQVVRGADLLDSTPRHIALQYALGYPTPDYWHVPLMTDYHGE